jgi:hypothetical protein
MEARPVKDEERKLVEELPDDASRDDLVRMLYVRRAIEAGLEDSEEGRATDVKDLRAGFGLK